MIIEPNPLHKKKKRLAKQYSNKVVRLHIYIITYMSIVAF